MRLKFSVIDQPIVKVLTMDDQVRELSFREVFEQAHLLQDISGDNALDRYAMFRLLLAFAMDMLELKTWRDRKALLQKGHFDMDAFDRYVALCEKDGPCFDILDQKHPFMQATFDEAMDATAIKSPAKLSPILPSGNNHMFWDHHPESVFSMSVEQAFRAMIGLYLFCTAQGQGFPSPVNNTTPVYVTIKGSNLFETMALNMVSVVECDPIPYGKALVPWRKHDVILPKAECANVTLLEAYTWQPRRITLECSESGNVRQIRLQQGKNFKGNDLWVDPCVPRYCSKKGDWLSLKPQPQRALWRDVGTILTDKERKQYRPPIVVTQATKLLDEETRFLDIHEIGLVTNQASYVEIMEDALSLPRMLFTDEDRAEVFIGETKRIESMQYSIGKKIAEVLKDQTDVQEEAQKYFLSLMHDELLGTILTELMKANVDDDESLTAYLNLSDQLFKKAVLNVLRDVVDKTGSTVFYLKAQTDIREKIMYECRKLIKERNDAYGL